MELFNAAVDLAPAARAAFVRDACGADTELMGEVSSLLEWDDETRTGGLAAQGSGIGARDEPVELPERIGPYEIVELLGVGGMSIVYRARQKHPDRLVALKVLRTGNAESLSSLRFKREIDLLARLHHPGIAQIHEAGSATNGTGEIPYFAMELVDGQPLTAYADSGSLDRTQRLQLLIRVCDAVEYAHQRGIIHRDLKPANILVEELDGIARPRILDFGIARLLESADNGHAFVTREHRVIGTLAYMSPEQLDPDQVIDTRSDVYALGVLGYELLTGRPPLDLTGLSPISAIRRIQSGPRPSMGRMDPNCRGDLSLIFDKTLSQDPALRYPSVAAFADDLRAYLENRPIRARAPGRLYLLRKFTQRNPVAVLLTCLTLVAIIAGAVGTGWGLVSAHRANRELQNQLTATTESSRFLVREVVAGLDAVAGTAEIRRALLERLLAQVEALRRREPGDLGLIEDHASVLSFLSDALAATNRDEEALKLREDALALYRELASREPESRACRARVSIALVKVGDMYRGQNRWDVARSYYEQAYAIDQELAAAEPDSIWFLDNLAWSHDRLGHLAMALNEFDEAAQHFEDRLAINHQLIELAPDRSATRHGIVAANGYLAEIAVHRDDPVAAERYFRDAYVAANELAANLPHHALYAEALSNAARDLGEFLARTGSANEAVEYLDRALWSAARLQELDPRDFHPLDLYFGAVIGRAWLALTLRDLAQADQLLRTAQDLANTDAAKLADDDVQRYYNQQISALAVALDKARSQE
jgi:tetratricopeptide (TPR) repeat protein